MRTIIVKFATPLPCGCVAGEERGRMANGDVKVRCWGHRRDQYVPPGQVSDDGRNRPRQTQVQRNEQAQSRMTGVPYHIGKGEQ